MASVQMRQQTSADISASEVDWRDRYDRQIAESRDREAEARAHCEQREAEARAHYEQREDEARVRAAEERAQLVAYYDGRAAEVRAELVAFYEAREEQGKARETELMQELLAEARKGRGGDRP